MLVTSSMRSTAISLASQAARRAVLSVLSNIRLGELTIHDHSSVQAQTQTYTFPSLPLKRSSLNDAEPNEHPKAELVVVNESFWLRMATMSDLGFAEAYMFADVLCSTEDLLSLFRIFLMNRPYLTSLESSPLISLASLPTKLLASIPSILPSPLTSSLSKLQARLGLNLNLNLDSLQTSRANIAAHYDLSNAMFEAFLSPDMTYSCAIFDNLDEDLGALDRSDNDGSQATTLLTPATTPVSRSRSHSHVARQVDSCTSFPFLQQCSEHDELHAAQLRKLEHIIHKLRIPTASTPIRVLEVGTGWGSLSLTLAIHFPHVSIDTLTLSTLQASHVRSLISSHMQDNPRSTLRQRVRIHEVSYATLRDLFPAWKGIFDRVVSIEMVEAVGKEKGALEGYWEVIDWALKEKGGLGVVMGITIPEGRYERYVHETDFIQKWVLFPGGHLPSLTQLITTLTSGTKGRLTIDSVSNIGPHYARTLREWRKRFCEAFGHWHDDAFDSDLDLQAHAHRVVPFKLKEKGGDEEDENRVRVRLEERKEKNERLRGALLEGRPSGSEMAENELDEGAVEVFRRKWIYYFVYCEIGFSTRSLGDHIITFTREANEGFGCDVFA